jgi:hypothetical protein
MSVFLTTLNPGRRGTRRIDNYLYNVQYHYILYILYIYSYLFIYLFYHINGNGLLITRKDFLLLFYDMGGGAEKSI